MSYILQVTSCHPFFSIFLFTMKKVCIMTVLVMSLLLTLWSVCEKKCNIGYKVHMPQTLDDMVKCILP